MKNIVLFTSCCLICVVNSFAQITSNSKAKLITASGLKVEIRIAPSVIVNQLPDAADMFFFKIFEVRDGKYVPNSLTCTSQLTEVGGFKVMSKPSLTEPAQGGKVYSFNITGLKAGQKYGVDVFPVNNRVSAPASLSLLKTGYTSGGYCNPSVVDGSTIRIVFQAVAPPK